MACLARLSHILRLLAPTTKYQATLEKGLRELVLESSTGAARQQLDNVAQYVSDARGTIVDGVRQSMGKVPYTEYWLMDDDQYLGTIQIRHKPSGQNPEILSNVYYHIIPSERGKGYGKAILRMGLEKAKALGLSEVLLAVKADNLASRAVIQHCGGVFVKESAGDESMLQYKIML